MLVPLLAAFLALAAPQTPTQSSTATAAIEGRVLRSGTMEPIPNVQVTLVKSNSSGTLSAEAASALDSLQSLIATAPAGISQATIDSLIKSREQALGLAPGTFALTSQTTALTDASGHFSFKDLAQGKYSIRATREGFFGPPVNGSASTNATKAVTIEAQKPVPAADLFMIQGGIISGRVRDPNGQPASGVIVGATRVTYSNGRPQWTIMTSKATDDRGEYRIFWIGPGEYYVGVTPRAVGTIPGPQDSWARTFFPGVSDPKSATLLAIKDGSEITGIDFSIQSTASATTFKISGKAINPLAVPNAATGVVDRSVSNFILSPREPGLLDSVIPPALQNALPASARTNGEFELRNVRPGSYDLIAWSNTPIPLPVPTSPAANGAVAPITPPPLRRYYISRTSLDVGNGNIDGLTLEIQRVPK